MPGESQNLPASGSADPTVFTTEQILRQSKAERDYVDGQVKVLETRLDAMDRATQVLHETVTRVPTDIQLAVSHLQSVLDERFKSVATQFAERDTRQERESRDNKVAVDAAFAAQKEAASEQNKSNTLAITKSELSTAETINKLSELVKSNIDGLADKIEDAKERIGAVERRIVAVEQRTVGATESKTAAGASATLVIGVLGVIVSVLAIAVVVILAIGAGP